MCEECKKLRERVQVLEDALGINNTRLLEYKQAFGLTPSQGVVFGILMRLPQMTLDAAMNALYAHKLNVPHEDVVRQFVFRLRKKLGRDVVLAVGGWTHAYMIPPEHKKRLREEIRAKVEAARAVAA